MQQDSTETDIFEIKLNIDTSVLQKHVISSKVRYTSLAMQVSSCRRAVDEPCMEPQM